MTTKKPLVEEREWETVGDLIRSMQGAHRRLRNGESTPDEVHAETRIMGNVLKAIAINLESARIGNRMRDGGDTIPDSRIATKRLAEPTTIEMVGDKAAE